jgi:cytochrome c553
LNSRHPPKRRANIKRKDGVSNTPRPFIVGHPVEDKEIEPMLWVASVARFKCPLFLAPLLLMSPGAFAAGNVVEKAQLCATCHGKDGVPIDKNIPVIWGQNVGYVYLQLRDFKSGFRKNELMSPIAATLEKNDMLGLAAYFSKLKWPNLQQPSAPNDVAAKALTASASVGCPGCHLEHFQGDGTTARLAGQRREYLAKTMADFRGGTRANNPGMSSLMKAAAPDSLEALAEYLAGLQVDAYLGQSR